MNLAINGFGRIGRLAFRVATLNHWDEIEQIVINTSGSIDVAGWTHLVKYDTTYKQYPEQITYEHIADPKSVTEDNPLLGYIIVKDKKFPVLAQKDPEKIPWAQYNIDVVIESTGIFIDSAGAGKHLHAGARKVVISAPAKGDDIKTFVLGVNQTNDEQIISNASCTTNCISPVTQVIHEKFGIEKALLATVHGYTDDQRLQDNSHKDRRRARAAAQNLIPTSTGAAVATTEAIPELKGKFDGIAIRVPVATGSLSNLVYVTSRDITETEVNQALTEASQSSRYQKIMTVTDEPIVSSDIVGSTFSTIVDLNFTKVIGGNLLNILAWYDNEWGYTNRLVEQAIAVAR
mgnify:CR=1 FL=1